jgi:hypothetical protein
MPFTFATCLGISIQPIVDLTFFYQSQTWIKNIRKKSELESLENAYIIKEIVHELLISGEIHHRYITLFYG